MSQGPATAVPPESGVPLDPELASRELLPEPASLELLPEPASSELLPELASPELLPELVSPELPSDPSLPIDPELLPAPESDSSCPPLASATESDGRTSEPQEQKVAIAAGPARSQRAPIWGVKSIPSLKVPSVCATAGRTAVRDPGFECRSSWRRSHLLLCNRASDGVERA
jgi:hypothetical protein